MENWKENEIVKKILSLQVNYVRRFTFAGTMMSPDADIKDWFECSCCHTLTNCVQSVYHKDNENLSTIGLCPSCSELWNKLETIHEKETKVDLQT